ncbi:replication initiation protein (plasmid) [Paracoccus liaowanqingii]|uniref:Replication initiation protein n=1 Tax=Paracoccus liaowanqingii TaxID=2560053 RepID=A0A4Y5SQJ4_9RHOB|nr:replication initiation protein [Paracoccus liaowanqingii]QDA35760.1 replication initiation protein [Paracoccus liaowanqingii]
MENDPKTTVSTLALRPFGGEMLKPAELVEVDGAEKLTLNARRAFNLLLHNAHGPDMAIPHKRFTIPLTALKFSHAGNERLAQAIKSLMRTIVTIRSPDRVELVPLLGRTTIADRKNDRGYLTYEFDPVLVELLRDSQIFAKLQLDVIHAVSSKYALALYEIVAKRARLSYVRSETFDIDQFRTMLGVEAGKLGTYSNLLKFAIRPAFEEVNRLAEFHAAFEPLKVGRKVGAIKIAWAIKSPEAQKLAYTELHGAPALPPKNGEPPILGLLE